MWAGRLILREITQLMLGGSSCRYHSDNPGRAYLALGAWGLLNREPFADGAPISYWINEYEKGDEAERELAVQVLGRIKRDSRGSGRDSWVGRPCITKVLRCAA